MLEAGLQAGRFTAGRLAVNKHFSATEAFVTGGAGGDILVSGSGDRNRAVDGDRVVVELRPKAEWVGRQARLAHTSDQEKDEGCDWERGPEVMATGRVVGVLERRWGSFIASLPREEAGTMEKAAGRRVLAVPYDRRIPKIRILTAQAGKLQGCRVLVRMDAWPVGSQYPQVRSGQSYSVVLCF